MSQLIHKFLENDERGKSILAMVGICAGVILLAVAIYAKYALR